MNLCKFKAVAVMIFSLLANVARATSLHFKSYQQCTHMRSTMYELEHDIHIDVLVIGIHKVKHTSA